MANSKLFLTDNNYQSYQSSTNKNGYLWKKIAQIGNYCQLKHQRCVYIEIIRFSLLSLANNFFNWILLTIM